MRWIVVKILSVLLFILTLYGCNGTRTCPTCVVAPKAERSRSDEIEWLEERLARAFSPRADKKTDQNTMLMLSGGGGYGAWGAGLLNGWTQANGRPVFDAVMGVSTGAIIGTFAFLGTPDGDAILRKLYTRTMPDDVYRSRLLLWALFFSPSIRDTWPLRDLITKHVTNAVIDRVRDEGKKGRLFVIATVNADVGVLRPWDMTDLAMSDAPDHYDRYRALLLASTAYPVLFPPVLIDNTLHIDGGTREQIFGHIVGKATIQAYMTLKPQPMRKPQAYLIVNGQLVVTRQCVSERIPAIGMRGIEIALTQGMIGNLYKIRSFLSPTWDLNLSMIPNEFRIDPSKDSFDKEQANEIYQEALRWTKTLKWIPEKDFPNGTEESPLPCLDATGP
jgi:predicted patatin/cPLA2 family phospholipase